MNRIILILMVALGITACNREMVYHHYEHVPNNGWEKNDTLSFAISPMAEAGTYHEDIELRINETYPFLGLTLRVEQTVYPRKESRHQTLSCSLIGKSGQPKGRGISYYQYSFPLGDLQLEAGDSVQIRITHNMKREIMPGVTDVGICLRRYAGK